MLIEQAVHEGDVDVQVTVHDDVAEAGDAAEVGGEIGWRPCSTIQRSSGSEVSSSTLRP